jgi:hypothetical protein
MLWGTSGNRCAICEKELVLPDEANTGLLIGQECDIVSERPNGPRHTPNYNDYDIFDNFILLCPNDHVMVDQLINKYTVENLKEIKAKHINKSQGVWQKSAGSKSDDPDFVMRVESGKELLNIIFETELSEFEYDEPKNQEEVNLVGGFLEEMGDYIDYTGMSVVEHGERAQLGFDFNMKLKDLDKKGWMVFGKRNKGKYKTAEGVDLGVMSCAVLRVLRKDNPNIINIADLMNQFKKFQEEEKKEKETA